MRKKSLGRFSLLVLLAVTVVASGCISDNGQTNKEKVSELQDDLQQRHDKIMSCTEKQIQILDASASEAFIRQTDGHEPIGELKVTWKLQNGEETTKTVSIDSSESVRANSGLSGTLKQVKANSTECPGAEDTFP